MKYIQTLERVKTQDHIVMTSNMFKTTLVLMIITLTSCSSSDKKNSGPSAMERCAEAISEYEGISYSEAEDVCFNICGSQNYDYDPYDYY